MEADQRSSEEQGPSADDRHAPGGLAALGELAAEVAHELRNTLLVIASNVYLAKQAPAASAAFLDRIERSVRVAQAIVDDVMALAEGAPRREATPLTHPIEMAREQLGLLALAAPAGAAPAAAAPAGAATFVDDIPTGLEVMGHAGLLARVFSVLYDNAVRVGQERGAGVTTITTHAHEDGDTVVITVSDDGPGVPEALRATLFQPLVHGRAGGTGLGLPLAARIARAHGGTIALVSPLGAATAQTEGATFRLVLPRART